ncbi:MAG: PKD domain-containing protein, partial [Bacteroidetes bacterium]|nr:PKD domain-containing protein [Bacteroidota bacterium]
ISWSFGDNTGETVENPVHQYPFPDTFLVTLVAYGPCGIDTFQQTVITLCIGTQSSFTYTTDSLDLKVHFINQSINADQYSWDFGDGNVSSDEEPIHTYPSPNYYETTLIAFGACEVDTFSQIIRPDCNVSKANFSAILNPENQTVSLTVNINNATTFSWNFGGGTGDSLALSPIISYPGPGLYNISLEVSNECGTAIYLTQIYLPPPAVGIEPSLQTDFQWRLYPNPASDVWWLESLSNNRGEVEILLVDLQGRIVFREKYLPAVIERLAVPARDLPSGYYWLKIVGEEGIQVIVLEKQ